MRVAALRGSVGKVLMKKGFTLTELLVVIAIIALLAAIIFPAFATVRGRARQTSCLSNLKQIGVATGMYMQDYDGRYPRAVDPIDRAYPALWNTFPLFGADIARFPLVSEVLQPYVKAKQIFVCPADGGFQVADFVDLPLDASPSSHEKFGTSYYYRTEFAALDQGESSVQTPAQINFLFDGAGKWHGTLVPPAKRFNCLFADFHAKNISYDAMETAWSQRVSP